MFFIANVDGTNERLITTASAATGTGAWSPDGTRVAFQVWGSCGENGNTCSQVWVAKASGAEVQKVADDADMPVWSPDSKHLAFAAIPERSNSSRVLTIANADGYAPSPVGPAEVLSSITWSPRGDRIAYVADPSSRRPRIRVVRLNGAPSLVIARATQPSWAARGDRLAFVRPGRIMTLRITALNATASRIVDSSWSIGFVRWSPSGGLLAYSKALGPSRDARCCDTQLFVADANSTRSPFAATRQPRSTVFEGVWWTRDASSLVFARRIATGTEP